MGAVVDSTSLARAQKLQINLPEVLANNNSHQLFRELGDALITGQTGTNVNDMLLILLEKKKSSCVNCQNRCQENRSNSLLKSQLFECRARAYFSEAVH